VQWNWNAAIRAVQDIRAVSGQPRGELPADGLPAVVLQCVDDAAKRAGVLADGAAAGERGSAAAASRTPVLFDADDAPRRQRIAARLAQRRRDRNNRVPACTADGSERGFVERVVAGGAGGREQDGEQPVKKVR